MKNYELTNVSEKANHSYLYRAGSEKGIFWAFRLSATPLSAVSSAKDAAAIGNANMVMIARVLQNHSRNKNQPVRIFYNLEDENKKLIFSASTSQLLLPIVIRFRLESPGSEC